MTSDSDDLEEALRQNLKLRRELAAEVAKAKGVSQRGSVYRLGWVLYWTCLIVAAVWAVGLLVAARHDNEGAGNVVASLPNYAWGSAS